MQWVKAPKKVPTMSKDVLQLIHHWTGTPHTLTSTLHTAHCTLHHPAPFEAQELIVMCCWWLVVAVAYFGSRTNLIILPQASHKPHKPTLPNLTFPLVLSCISGQLHVFHCSAVYLFFITQQAHKIGSV